MEGLERLKEVFSRDTLAKVIEVVKQVGIYESMKAILKQPQFREAIKKKFEEMGALAVDKYGITDHKMKVSVENGKCILTAEIEIPDEEARKEFIENLNKTVKSLYDPKFSIMKLFHKEFEIESISCKERDGKVVVRVVANERLKDLLVDVGGGLIEEG